VDQFRHLRGAICKSKLFVSTANIVYEYSAHVIICVCQDMGRTRQVYHKCLEIIPHNEFTFSKIWIMAGMTILLIVTTSSCCLVSCLFSFLAEFEIRCKQVQDARMLLGRALGRCAREKIYQRYIELEHMMGQPDRCRQLYQKYLEFMPENCEAWYDT
jgi:crooked neck